jgi:chromosome segregation ATPase
MGDVSVPAEALAKFRRLKGRAEDLRAALHRLSQESGQVQTQLGKLQAAFEMASRGRNYIIGDDGELYQLLWHEEDSRGQGDSISRRHRKELKKVRDEGLAHITADILRARQELAQLDARRHELTAQITPLDALVNACRRELANRGWREDGRVGASWARPAMPEGEAA